MESYIPTISFRVVRPYRTHLEAAKGFANEPDAPDHYQSAIVMAQTACEMCAEDTIRVFFQVMGLDDLFEPMAEFIPSFNLASDDPKVRNLYMAICGDKVSDQPFWDALTELPKKTNRIRHAGETATKEEAEQLCAAAEQFINHVERVGDRSPKWVGSAFARMAPTS